MIKKFTPTEPGDYGISNEPCSCAPGECLSPDAPNPAMCINRLPGDVRVLQCDVCNAGTWHQDRKCIPCMRFGRIGQA